MVSLTWDMVINCLKINNPSGAAIMLCCDNHSAAPFCRLIHRDTFYDSKSLVTVETCFNILHPVGRYLGWLMDSHGLSIL